MTTWKRDLREERAAWVQSQIAAQRRYYAAVRALREMGRLVNQTKLGIETELARLPNRGEA